jgi:hypothetical protein
MTTPTDNKLAEALRKIESALRKDSRQKDICGDDVEYHLDGQTMYYAINAAREALREHEAAKDGGESKLVILEGKIASLLTGAQFVCSALEPAIHYRGMRVILSNDDKEKAALGCQQLHTVLDTYTQEEGNSSIIAASPNPVASAGLPDRLDVPPVTANGLSDEVVKAACVEYSVLWGKGKEARECMRAALVAAYPRLLDDLAKTHQTYHQYIDAIRTDNERLRADAARYRWLRERNDDAPSDATIMITVSNVEEPYDSYQPDGDDLDSEIDAAIAAAEEKGHHEA